LGCYDLPRNVSKPKSKNSKKPKKKARRESIESDQNLNPNELCSSTRTSRELLLADHMDSGLIQRSKFSTFDKEREKDQKPTERKRLSDYRELNKENKLSNHFSSHPIVTLQKNLDIPQESSQESSDSNILL
jgi:hypothetical protein